MSGRLWLPFPSGKRVYCSQGPHSAGRSHADYPAWDFADEGYSPGGTVVAAAPGRVVQVIDDRTQYGENRFRNANRIVVDHGQGRFTTYLHNQAGSAEVEPGELVGIGTPLAAVGRTGTIQPHLHFDLRGPTWETAREVRFRTASGPRTRIKEKTRVRSATPSSQPPPVDFVDSRLRGDEFELNGVVVDSPGLAYWRQASTKFRVTGRVTREAATVGFYLWKDGQRSEVRVETEPDADGRFELEVSIPVSSIGPRWYRITTRRPDGRYLDNATLPAMVTTDLPGAKR